MLDIKFLRENPDVVKQNIKNKFQDDKLPLVDEVIALDAEARKTQQEADELRASRKKISKEIGALMGQGKKEEAEAKKQEVNKMQFVLRSLQQRRKNSKQKFVRSCLSFQILLIQVFRLVKMTAKMLRLNAMVSR